MKNVNAKGRLLTLKLMKRHPEAPIEPPKVSDMSYALLMQFLGHGWCETFNKAAPILTKGGGSTDDAGILGVEAVKLLRAMKLDPVELRGVGIQITKLDAEKGEREVGQGVLSFPKPQPPEPIKVDTESTPRTTSVVNAVNAVAGPSRVPNPPSSEGIDPDFLAALPEDLQQEVKADHARTRAAKRAAEQVIVPAEPKRVKAAPTRPISAPKPPVARSSRNAAAHISKQLRPKVKTQLKAGQIADLALYSAWNKAGNGPSVDIEPRVDKGKAREDSPASVVSEVVDLTVSPEAPGRGSKRRRSVSTDRASVDGIDGDVVDDGAKIGLFFVRDLELLGIDPDVFGALPEDMQKEVVEEERRKARQRKILHRPADTSRQRARERESDRRLGFSRGGTAGAGRRTASASLSPTRTRGALVKASARGTSGPAAAVSKISIKRVTRPSLLNATDLPDVLRTIERWVDSRGDNGPAERDSKKVLAYMLKLLESGQGLGGVEVIVECLGRMRLVLEEKWGEMDGSERGMSVGAGAGAQERDKRIKAAEEWWATWTRFRDAVSEGMERSLGAGLRL